MQVKAMAVLGFMAVAGAAALWRALGRRRRQAAATDEPRHIRNAGRLVAGGGVRRIT